MDGRSRLDRYQNLRAGMNSRNENANENNRPQSFSNSFENTNSYSGLNQNAYQRNNTASNKYQTSEYDSLLKEHEDFLKSLDAQFDSMSAQTDTYNKSVVQNNNNSASAALHTTVQPSNEQTQAPAQNIYPQNNTQGYVNPQQPANPYTNPYNNPQASGNPYMNQQQPANPYANPYTAPVQNNEPYANQQFNTNPYGSTYAANDANFYSLPSSFSQSGINPYSNNNYSQPSTPNPADPQYYQNTYNSQNSNYSVNNPVQQPETVMAAPAQSAYESKDATPQQQQMASSMSIPFSDIRTINREFAESPANTQNVQPIAPAAKPVETTNDFGMDLVNNSRSEVVVPSAISQVEPAQNVTVSLNEPEISNLNVGFEMPSVPNIPLEKPAEEAQPVEEVKPITENFDQPHTYSFANTETIPAQSVQTPAFNQPQSFSMPAPAPVVPSQPQSYTYNMPQINPVEDIKPAVAAPQPVAEEIIPQPIIEETKTEPTFMIDDEPEMVTPAVEIPTKEVKPKEDFSIDDIDNLVGNMDTQVPVDNSADDSEIIMDKTATYDEFDSYINSVLNEFTKQDEPEPQSAVEERVSLEEKAPELFVEDNNNADNIDQITREISGWNYNGPELSAENQMMQPQAEPDFDYNSEIVPDNTIAQPIYYDDPANVADLTQNLEKEKALNDELLEKTRALDYTISEYENELDNADQSMSKTNRILNLVLTALILTLLVILFIIGYWFIKERGISL